MNGFGHPQFPMMYPGAYSPGQMVFNNNPELSQLISVFGGGLLSGMVSPGHFMPQMMPTQQVTDQFAMRNYQQQQRQAAFNIAGDNTSNVAAMFLGLRSGATKDTPTDLNRAQADQMAEIVNSPVAKILLGQFMGPENMEALLHGQRGDVSALGSAISRVGYFRDNPMGNGRMNADALTSYTRAVYSELYEPGGNLDSMMTQAQDDDDDTRTKARRRLKRAAIAGPLREKMSDDEIDATTQIVEDADVVTRLTSLPKAPARVSELYKKYVQGGTETDTLKQAESLVKFDRAVKEADVLSSSETTLSGLRQRAEMTPVHEMHGFMAGQVGQIKEHLFQRGLMPKSLGRMNADDRFQTIGESFTDRPLDEETTRRIAREMAERSLLDPRNNSADAMNFRGDKSVARREKIIDDVESDFSAKLENAQTQVQKRARGDADALTNDEMAQLPGMPDLAANVDGRRAADAVKKYTGAVSAIRDIFGDNGNPNAPIPALLAALEGLTGGAVGSMRPQQIESTLRQMQSTAKEAGIGFEQMAAMSTQIDAQAAQMGLTPADAMRIKPAAMAAIKTMQDTGVFSNPIYGQLDRGSSGARVGELITAGAASGNAKAMGALESIYRADPDRFAEDSEVAQMIKAHRGLADGGDGNYTFKNEAGKFVTRNVQDFVGEHGQYAIIQALDGSKVARSEFAAQYNNPANRQFVDPMFGYLTQRASAINEMRIGAVQGKINEALDDSNALDGIAPESKDVARQVVARAVTGLIVETAGLAPAEQQSAIKERAGEQIQQQLITAGYDEATARAVADNTAAAMRTTDGLVNQLVGSANSYYSHRTGGEHMSEFNKRAAGGRPLATAQEAARQRIVTERRQAAGVYYETAPMARFSDYLRKIGSSGESLTTSGVLDAIIPQTTDRRVFNDFYQESKAGINILSELQQESAISRKDVDAAVKEAETNPEKNGAALKKIAGIGDATQLVTAEVAKEKTAEALGEKTVADLETMYKKYSGAAMSAGMTGNKEKLLAGLNEQMAARADVRLAVERDMLGDKFVSIESAAQRAVNNIDTVKEGFAERNGQIIQYSDLAMYRDQIEGGLLKGDADSVGVASLATLKAYGANLNDVQQEKLTAALTTGGEAGADAVQKLKGDTEFLGGVDHRDKMFTLFETLQKNYGVNGGRILGLDNIPNDKDFLPPSKQQEFAKTIADAIKEALKDFFPDAKKETGDPANSEQRTPGAAPPVTAPVSGSTPPAKTWFERLSEYFSGKKPEQTADKPVTDPKSDKPLVPPADEKERVARNNDAALAQASGAGTNDAPAPETKPIESKGDAVQAANDATLAQASGAGTNDAPGKKGRQVAATAQPTGTNDAPAPETKPIESKGDAVQAANDATLAQANGLNSANIQPGSPPAAAASVITGRATESLAQTLPDGASTTPQQYQRQLTHALPANLQTVHANQRSAQPAGGSAERNEVKLNGVLELRGLNEAILNATGSQVIETGGAPVIFDAPDSRMTSAARLS